MTVDDRALLLATLDAAVDAIIVSDKSGNILLANKAAVKMFGRSNEELIGANARILMPKEMAAQHDSFIKKYIETGQKRIIGVGRDVEGLRADGTVFPLHLSVGPANIEGETAFVAIMHDLTKRKAAEKAAARSQRMEAVGQMTGGIAHDFNNLLTVVIGNLELLEMKAMDADSLALVSDALEAAGLGAELTSRLMVFSRKSVLKSEVVALNHIINQTLAIITRTIGAHISIEFDLSTDLWPIHTDPILLKTAILNLALNAQDALTDGGHIRIETSNFNLDDSYVAQEIGIASGRYIRLSVSDTGDGMSPDVQHRAMEPFFTTKPVGKGTGLGLSLVYGFVKQSGGHLVIYSELGEGTTISLYFPVIAHVDEQQASANVLTGKQSFIGFGRLVLIVEDDPRVLRLSETRLSELGFTCITAATGDAAWEILTHRNDIDLVFTDLVMPGELSGHGLAKRVALNKPDLRVLITSGFSESVLRGGRIQEEFQILRKPYRQADLIVAIQDVLERG